MSAYVIAHYNVEDWDTFAKYPEPAMKTVMDHGGKFHVVAGVPDFAQPRVVEGSTDHAVIVVIEFPSQDAIDSWYNSPEYQAVVAKRLESTVGGVIFVDAD